MCKDVHECHARQGGDTGSSMGGKRLTGVYRDSPEVLQGSVMMHRDSVALKRGVVIPSFLSVPPSLSFPSLSS